MYQKECQITKYVSILSETDKNMPFLLLFSVGIYFVLLLSSIIVT